MSACNAASVPLIAGSTVKSLGQGRYGGFGVPFGGAPDCDLDVFYPDMTLEDLGLDDGRKTIPIMFAHGQDKEVGKRRLARAAFELRPKQGLWVEWKFERTNDPVVSNIRSLADEGLMALSSSAAPHMVHREAKGDFYLIKVWPVVEVSLTGSACCLTGQTKVEVLKDFEGLSLNEMVRRQGMTEAQLMREQSEEIRFRALRTLNEATKCEESEFMRRQREKRVRLSGAKPSEQALIGVTLQTARERLRKANELYEEAQKLLSGAERESAASVKFRNLEDWIYSGQQSGFINWGRF